jgi:hypothetical protein
LEGQVILKKIVEVVANFFEPRTCVAFVLYTGFGHDKLRGKQLFPLDAIGGCTQLVRDLPENESSEMPGRAACSDFAVRLWGSRTKLFRPRRQAFTTSKSARVLHSQNCGLVFLYSPFRERLTVIYTGCINR